MKISAKKLEHLIPVRVQRASASTGHPLTIVSHILNLPRV